MERIASLLPSTTEIACALGFEANLVGRSHECDFPGSVASLPVLTEPKLDPGAASKEIDDRVKQLVRDGLSVYRVDADRLAELAPTLVLTQDQCDVCAASLADVERALSGLTIVAPRVVSLHPRTLGDVWGDIVRVADVLDVADRGSALCAQLADRVTDVAERALRIREQPTVACIEWIEPLMAAGNWMPELVTLAGGHPVTGESGAHSPWIDAEDLARADPDVIVVMPCGFDLARTRREARTLESYPTWPTLRAVRESRVYLADGHHFMNRPGPRLVESLEIMSEIIHPSHFEARHRGRGWEAL